MRSPTEQNKHSRPPTPASLLPLEWLGWLLFSVGALGLVLPVLPTTIFWIGAAWCWSRSSPHRLKRLLEHPQLGLPLQQFLDNGEIARAGKLAATGGITFSFGCWYLFTQPSQTVFLWVVAGYSLLVLWLITRPEPRSDTISEADA